MGQIRKKLIIFMVCMLAMTIAACSKNEQDVTAQTESEKVYLSDLEHGTIGVVEGNATSVLVSQQLPDATKLSFNSPTDMSMALLQGKIDAFATDESYLVGMKWEGYEVTRVEEPLGITEYGIVFPKGERSQKYRKEINSFLIKSREDGSLEKLEEKWFSGKEPTEFLDASALQPENGTLIVGTCSAAKPFVYIKNGKLAGFDIEFLILFAREYGYALDFRDSDFTGAISGVQQKYDMATAGFTITEERKESVDFSDVYTAADLIYIVNSTRENEGVWNSLITGFDKTFIRENRWKLIAEGVGITLLISICATVLGTAIGFGLYMLRRSQIGLVVKITGLAAGIYSRIIAGTPTVVILMILYYVVFGKVDISGVIVAIITFALTFGASVYENMVVSVEGVDKGQSEAAYALGYSRNRTFFRIVLPQSMRAFMPVYSGEVVSLIKGTAVVGYIAVNDLTKMGDIIRSNTYEAFFPLIATAVIYFMITWLMALTLDIVRKRTEPKRRKREHILKGVDV